VTVVYNGATVALLGRNADGSWVLIRTQSGVQGWVNSSMLLISVPINSLPVVSGGPPGGTGATGVVSTGMLNVRTGPGMAFPVVTKVAQGQTVTLLGRNANSSWLLVRTSGGQQGWVNSAHINASVPLSSLPVVDSPPSPNHATVSVSALNVRVAPSPNAPLVGTVLYGAELGLLGRNSSGTWVLVQTPGGAVGWVNSTYVIPSVPISSLPVMG
jgi:N-acetylmuramoyl-L-alanine amidase